MNPNMIHQIFMEGEVGCPVLNLMICMEKFLKRSRYRVCINQLTLKILPLIIDTIITLLLNDHVVHDHISSHDLPHLLNNLLLSSVTNNGPTRLENTKCSLHIFPTSLLFFRKPTVFLLSGITMCLHKNRPLQIDTIN
jgi:hypothetical protein